MVDTPTPAIPLQPRLYIPAVLGENISRILMFDRFFKPKPDPKSDSIQVGSRSVSLLFVQNHRARRYLLRLGSDGVARVTVPRRGSLSTAREFVGKNHRLSYDNQLENASLLLVNELKFLKEKGCALTPTESVLPFLVRRGFHPSSMLRDVGG